VASLQRLTGEVHLADVLARWPLEHRRLADAHHEFMIEPLHDERYPGKAAFYPHQLQFWETLRQAIDDPVGEMDQAVVHERQRVHRYEAVELQEGRIAPVETRVERQWLARFLDHGIKLHVLVVMHGFVARAGDREADHALGVAKIPDDVDTGLRRIEGQI